MPTITLIKPQKNGKGVNVYIDESGILRNVGVSVYCITICNTKDSYLLDNQILKIENKLRIYPFHWREQSWKIKIKFLREILKIDSWICTTIIINNKTFEYNLLQNLLGKALQGLNINRMYIDGRKMKKYVFSVKRSFKQVRIKVSSLKMVKHQNKGGLRISDAVAGLVRLNYDKRSKKEARLFFSRFLNKKITTQILSGYQSNPPHGR